MRTASTLLVSAALLIAADTLPGPSDFTVHEWGTFTSVAGEDGTAIEWEALGGKNDLPSFVRRQYPCLKSGLSGTVRMETPVLYFYSPREITASVNVAFPHGAITEWYPNGENAIYESKGLMDQMSGSMRPPMYSADAVFQTKNLIGPEPAGLGAEVVKLGQSLNGLDFSMRSVMSAISWKGIKIEPRSSADFPTEKGPSHYYAARATDAAPITASGQHEKFLFYRGVGRIPAPLSARILTDGRVALENLGTDAVPAAILFENRGGRIGFRDAGAIQGTVTLDAPTLDGSFIQLRDRLETALAAQGLFPKEAHAMVETWRDSWFEEGSRLIYIVPSRTVDEMLPLQVDPAPSKIARVFVGRIELITADTKRAMDEAFAAGNWPVVERYGRFVEPILQRIAAEGPLGPSRVAEYRRNMPDSIRGGGCH